jgi:GAF domain-containing protein
MPHPAQARLRDPARLTALHDLRLMDTPAEEALDRLTRLAARVLRTPVALISLVDEHRQFFKSAVGLAEPWAARRETLLTHSFCQHVVVRASLLAIEDARADPRVRENGAVKDLGVIAYLGAPLTLAGGHVIGSFCVADSQPRRWSADDQQTMSDLAASVMSEIRLRMYKGAQAQPYASAATVSGGANVAQTLRALRDRGLRELSGHGNENARSIESSLLEPSVLEPSFLEQEPALDHHHPTLLEQRARLTKRQGEVFDLLMQGFQSKEIARALSLSHRTVEVHRAMILERLHVSSFQQLLKQMLAGPGPHR